ncbi:hypothetical protein [Rhizobium ruizarguesonis]|uniref:hypothetical protein n=1 Tax=Rhizobium ruizarguesonis TaxID=2081791 RepID=UPI001CF5F8C1|nr:hypothetical protein [Rhizobium ruizarguesonis]MCB2399377.1 hypothetical protein [Rhizobium ruizarguesonis]
MPYTLKNEIPVEVRRKAAAFHEAGHLLVATVLGRKVTGAILRPPHGTNGETQFEDEPEVVLDLKLQDDRSVIENHVVVLMAGEIAEAIVWDEMRPLFNPLVDTHRDDVAMIKVLKEAFYFDQEEDARYEAHCRGKTASIVHEPVCRAALEEIARHLQATFAVTREESDAILRKHNVL